MYAEASEKEIHARAAAKDGNGRAAAGQGRRGLVTLIALLGLGVPTHAVAEVLVSNMEQANHGTNPVASVPLAQKFTTGAERPHGYWLRSVSIRLAETKTGLDFRVSINSASGDEPRGSALQGFVCAVRGDSSPSA